MDLNITERQYKNFTWLDINQPTDEHFLQIAKKYNLELNAVKDSIQPGHLPKIEKIKDFEFIILRAYTANETDNIATVEGLSNKVAFFYNESIIITIHRTPFQFIQQLSAQEDDLHSVYEILIVLWKEIIMSYEVPSQWQTKQIDKVENILFLKKDVKISLEDLYFQKAEARISKKLLLLTQSVVNKMQVPENNQSALQDLKESLLKLIMDYEEVLEDASNLMHSYMSITAQKNNDVVKLLTIFSAFFLPLTFIVGVYGMNFDFMPELRWKFGYLYIMLFMLMVCILIFVWFKKKKII